MAKLTKTLDITYEVTPDDVAVMFCSMDEVGQAEFFNEVAEQVSLWPRPFVFQLQAIIDCPKLNGGGITIMREIGEYGEGTKANLQKYATTEDLSL